MSDDAGSVVHTTVATKRRAATPARVRLVVFLAPFGFDCANRSLKIGAVTVGGQDEPFLVMRPEMSHLITTEGVMVT